MRYFRYHNTDKSLNCALKEQYKLLTEDEKRTFRKEKRWKTVSCITFYVVFILSMAACVLLLNAIPTPNTVYLEIPVIIGKVVLGFILLPLCALFSYALTLPLWKKLASFHVPSMKKEIFSKACKHLRDHYRIQEPYLITKCFDATDRKFQNHDVCIFIVGDELRITGDLVHGFLHGERDLGCYAFDKEEITLSKHVRGNQCIAELRAGETVFLLGYRAKGFIQKNFLENTVV